MIRFKTAKEIRKAFASGEMTAVAIVQSVLDDIHARDESVGAFLETFDDDALARAKELDAMKARGEDLPRLAGVPVAIKDNMLKEGFISSSGSRILAEYRATYSATVVTRLEAAGAIVVGRTNMDEFAMGSSTETSAWQETANPWNTELVPGGSSGGSCVAVAAGFVPIALGSDTGGSIRQPAALCGIVGMKPSYGRVSRYGITALASSLDQVGPFAHTVEDAALVLEVLEGKDEKDSTSVDLENTTVPELLTPSFKGMRVGVPKEFFVEGVDPEVRARIEEAVAAMKENGAEIVDISLPLTPYALPAYYIIQPAEASSNLGRYDGMRYGTRGRGGLEESYVDARGKGFGTEVKRRIILGTFILSAGYYDAYYKKALAVRTAIRQEFDDAFKQVDVIVGPTSPTVAWKLGEITDPIAMYLADIFTVSANVAGIAGMNVPCGMAHDLPVGLQFLAGAMQDGKAITAAAAYQAVTDWHTMTPSV